MSKRSFIEEARREQIVSATIETLAEVGYVKTSLSQIAKRAGISTSLIPYHFNGKDDLIAQTVEDVSTAWMAYVERQVAEASTAREQLSIYIESNLAYMGTRPKHFLALLEIVFNVRDEDGTLRYINEEEDPAMIPLENLLRDGQQGGEFRQFDVHNMAVAIRGTIEQYLGQMNRERSSLESYTKDIIDVFDRATRKTAEDDT
jgi:AcrR family transcriptional regulator